MREAEAKWVLGVRLLRRAAHTGTPEAGKSSAGQESRFESFLVNNAAGMSHEEGSETSFRIFFFFFNYFSRWPFDFFSAFLLCL